MKLHCLKYRNNPEKIANENETVAVKDDNKKIPIYNYVSSNVRPLRWKDFMYYNELAEPEIPSVLAVSHGNMIFLKILYRKIIIDSTLRKNV